MKICKLSQDERVIINNNDGLKRYLRSLETGKEMTPRSWLYENLDPEDVLSQWMLILSSLRDKSQEEKNVFQFDTSQLEKWGPQGGVKPIDEILDEILIPSFSQTSEPEGFSTPEWKLAKRRIIADFESLGITNLRPRSYVNVVDDMRARDTLESNSGWPLFTRRSKADVVEQSIEDVETGNWKDYPAIVLFRNYNQKTRPVWMYPMSANIKEGSFVQPLQSAIINAGGIDFIAPWIGFDQVKYLVGKNYSLGNYLMASDFSQTDIHFSIHATMQVCDVIETCFQSQYREQLRDVLIHMHTIPLIIGPDRKIVGEHGVSSGSNWTNFIETIFDMILSEYVYNLTDGKCKGLYGIGDDMTWVSHVYDDSFPDFLEKVGKSVGQVINASKTTCEPNKVKSLQRLFQRDYMIRSINRRKNGISWFGNIRGVYSTIRALKSSIYPERFHNPKKWNSDMFCARQFMILENCVDHPLFKDFVKFICKGHRDLIPFARSSAKHLNKVTRESKLLPGLNPTYNQESRDSSLEFFKSIQIAREL